VFYLILSDLSFKTCSKFTGYSQSPTSTGFYICSFILQWNPANKVAKLVKFFPENGDGYLFAFGGRKDRLL